MIMSSLELVTIGRLDHDFLLRVESISDARYDCLDGLTPSRRKAGT